MLRKLGQEVGIDDATTIMSEDARKDLVLLSGGVPRDYLNIFVDGLVRARNLRSRVRVTPTDLRKAAASLSHESKFSDLRDAAGGEAPEQRDPERQGGDPVRAQVTFQVPLRLAVDGHVARVFPEVREDLKAGRCRVICGGEVVVAVVVEAPEVDEMQRLG